MKWNEAAGDEDKLKAVFNQMEVDDEAESMTWRRIGKKEDAKHRPLLVTVKSVEQRNYIVSQNTKLKDSDGGTRCIRVKKDRHPDVRREWKRLFDLEAEENAKPENAGCNIYVDKKNRTVLCDGSIIDRWRPLDFS